MSSTTPKVEPGTVPAGYKAHTESSTTILVPESNTAFLNPVQQYNRDLSIAVIRAWNEMRKEEALAKHQHKKERQEKGKGKGKKVEEGTAGEQPQSEAGPSKPYQARKITILEALSATGLRSIRYAKEIPDVRTVLANDISASACEAMRMNVEYNNAGPSTSTVQEDGEAELSPEEQAMNAQEGKEADADSRRRPGCDGYVTVNESDACMLMYEHRHPSKRVEVVDLDPYGTAAPFIDGAVQCVTDGGLLAVTCTDLAVLAGHQYPEKCYSNYGGASVNTSWSHEAALRLVLGSLSNAAARYGRYITPLISFSIDFYVRLFVRVDSKANEVKKTASRMGVVYCCHFCHSYHTQPFGRIVEKEAANGNTNVSYKTAPGPPVNGSLCGECGSTLHLGGPMWLAPIHDTTFVHRVLKSIEGSEKDYGTWPRINGMLTLAANEIEDPFYLTANKMFGTCHSSSASTNKVLSALLNGGYKISRSHASPGSIKTNAPCSFMYDIVREHIKTNPVRMDKIAENSPARRALNKAMTHEIDFTPHPDVKNFERSDKIAFYPENPQAHWGPASRAKNVAAGVSAGMTTSVEKRKSESVDGGEVSKKVKVTEVSEEEGMNA